MLLLINLFFQGGSTKRKVSGEGVTPTPPFQQLSKMQQCQGFKSDGVRCGREEIALINPDATHLHFCRTHWNVYDRRAAIRRTLAFPTEPLQHHQAGTCHTWVANSHWCGRTCHDDGLMCRRHAENLTARAAARDVARANQVIDAAIQQDILQSYRQHVPGMSWRQVIDDMIVRRPHNISLAAMYHIAYHYFRNPTVVEPELIDRWQFERYWRWNVQGRIGNPPDLLHFHNPIAPVLPPQNVLEAIARDKQNVHTRIVSEQTNKGLQKLLKESNGNTIVRAPEWFAGRWLLRSYGKWDNVARTVNDMLRWYNTQSCRVNDDWLYRRTLDGLYVTIRKLENSDTKTELFQRVFEECFESIGLCCDGHISRLCNVLVGFDDTFTPPVPFGEILQNKMAAIHSMNIQTEEKIRQATAFFNEFAVPETDRVSWLEAF